MNKRSFNTCKGFTLVETIVTIVILSIIMFSVMYIMVEGFRVWSENKNYIGLRSDGRYALARFQAEFRGAESVVTPVPLTEITFTADIDNNGAPKEITYALDGRELKREEPGLGQAVICVDVDSFELSWDPALLILTVELELSKGGDIVDLKTEIFARCLP